LSSVFFLLFFFVSSPFLPVVCSPPGIYKR
jgi:hypothetical protein